MNTVSADSFEIVNGPEDGVAFPVVRTPVTIGASMDCGIFINFDQEVHPLHARVTVVSGGYRIRNVSGAPTFVNNKRAGSIHSRIVRQGDIVRVGETSLCLVCVPDGLASRSMGMPTESNVVWLFRSAFGLVGKIVGLGYRLLFRTMTRANRIVVALVVAGAVLFFLQPAFFQQMVFFVRGWVRYLWSQLPMP